MAEFRFRLPDGSSTCGMSAGGAAQAGNTDAVVDSSYRPDVDFDHSVRSDHLVDCTALPLPAQLQVYGRICSGPAADSDFSGPGHRNGEDLVMGLAELAGDSL